MTPKKQKIAKAVQKDPAAWMKKRMEDFTRADTFNILSALGRMKETPNAHLH